MYCVDDSSTASEAEVENFIQKLVDWKDRIPCDARQHSADKPTTMTDTLVIDGYGCYVRSSLLPVSSSSNTVILHGVLLQAHKISPSSTPILTENEHPLLEEVHRSMWRRLLDLQKVSPEHSSWLLTHAFALCLLGRSDSCVLHLDIATRGLQHQNLKRYERV